MSRNNNFGFQDTDPNDPYQIKAKSKSSLKGDSLVKIPEEKRRNVRINSSNTLMKRRVQLKSQFKNTPGSSSV